MAHVVESRRHWPPAPPRLLAGLGCGLLAAVIVAGAGPGVLIDRQQDGVGTRTTDVALERLERALERGDGRAAARAWHDAHVSALRGDWRARVAVGDAALRLRDAGADEQTALARARQDYLAALFVARAARSGEGVIRVAEAFAALGDGELALQSLRVAEALDPPADAAREVDARRSGRACPRPRSPRGPPDRHAVSDRMRFDPIRSKVALALGVYLLALGFLGGILVERVRFDHARAAVLERYDMAVRDWKTERMAIELRQARARSIAIP